MPLALKHTRAVLSRGSMFGPEHPYGAAQNGQIHRVRELISGCQGLEVGRKGETTNRYKISSCGDKHALELEVGSTIL